VIESPLQRRAPLPPQLTRRVGVLGVLIFVLFGILAFRLWYLQVLTGTQNAAEATANVVQDVPIPAPRGNVLDRNGNLLAGYRVAPEVAIVADELPAPGPARRLVYRRLAALLGISWQSIRATVDDQAVAPPGYAPTDIMDDVPTRAWSYIGERASLFPGVVVRQVYVRYYPQGDIGAVVLGALGQITGGRGGELGSAAYKGVAPGTVVGQTGLEAEYQPYLQGIAGVQHVEIDAAGYPIAAKPAPREPVPGDQLSTSLDLGLEREGYIAVDEAEQRARAMNNPAPAAAFVAMDPMTGRILALGSVPTYNANAFATTVSTRTYRAILAEDHALVDRAIDTGYPTGSTFKPITALAALNAGLITPQTLAGAGACYTTGTGAQQQRFCNSGGSDYGNENLVGALMVSEDTYFYPIGSAANGNGTGEAIQQTARALGLGRSPGIDLPGGGYAGIVPDYRYVQALDAEDQAQYCDGTRPKPKYANFQLAITGCSTYFDVWTVGQNIQLATGQGFLEATPLQMAIAYSAIVNGGKVWSPKIGEQILSPSGTLVAQLPSPTFTRAPINATEQAVIMAGLHYAAQSPPGTSYATFGSFPRPVYGKTGTAQHAGQADQSWYVVYAPDPKRPIVIAVTVEKGGFGAAAAAPAARLMLSQWFHLPEKWVAGASTDL
jgi:penicillin-binding protein 2